MMTSSPGSSVARKTSNRICLAPLADRDLVDRIVEPVFAFELATIARRSFRCRPGRYNAPCPFNGLAGRLDDMGGVLEIRFAEDEIDDVVAFGGQFLGRHCDRHAGGRLDARSALVLELHLWLP